jgi:hypothetical protein
MPLDLTSNNHTWVECCYHDHNTERMPIMPDERDLLGLPGVKAEQPKIYLRRLWLPAENDRVTYLKFHDTDIAEMTKHAYKVINDFSKCDEKMHEELQSGSFLEKDAEHILEGRGYGRRI